jgi:ankyrin repeat domain-containing protein 50
MLRALVLQLLSLLNDNYGLLLRLYDSCRIATLFNHALADYLYQLVRTFEYVYIILDALDESPRDKHRRDML